MRRPYQFDRAPNSVQVTIQPSLVEPKSISSKHFGVLIQDGARSAPLQQSRERGSDQGRFYTFRFERPGDDDIGVDYHPDHRYTGVLVQDASYMVIVPNLVKDTPPLSHNPVFLYYSDRFTRPQAFQPDIVVSIDDVFDKKIDMLDAHVSQVYEGLPWTTGTLDQVPKDALARKKWLAVLELFSRSARNSFCEGSTSRIADAIPPV